MKILLPAAMDISLDQRLAQMAAAPHLQPFNESATAFVAAVSTAIMRDVTFRPYPELIAMAYWLRKSNISKMHHEFIARLGDELWKPRGVVLHFAPSNVDSIFIYSWFTSMLVGNSNIIRVSQKQTEQNKLLLAKLNVLLQEDRFQDLRGRCLVLTYDHEQEITEKLSNTCHVRVIWGGDETIKTIRRIPLPPMSTELIFPDRYSQALLSCSTINACNEEDFSSFIEAFFNDVFWFDQMACSSPRTILWLGAGEELERAKKRFWTNFNAYVAERRPELAQDPALQMVRFNAACEFAALGKLEGGQSDYRSIPVRLSINQMDDSMRQLHCGAGLFLECDCDNLDAVARNLGPKDQTLSVFGVKMDELRTFIADLPFRTIDRIVPVGKALDFSVHWDGYYLFREFLRGVELLGPTA